VGLVFYGKLGLGLLAQRYDFSTDLRPLFHGPAKDMMRGEKVANDK